jgi:hypothetical protein
VETNIVRIKPHHFVDIITALGAGKASYEPHPYGHALHTVAAAILADRGVLLEMELGADDICRPCVHNIEGRCDDTIDTSFRPDAPSSKREYNLLIDRRWCDRLKLAAGERIVARELCRLAGEAVGDLAEIYRELPSSMRAERAERLRAGIKKFEG